MPDNPVTPSGIFNKKGDEFAGSASCVSCHKEISESFSHTAHAITSAEANAKTVKGSFYPGKNIFALNYYERVVMEKRDSGMYQQALHGKAVGESNRFDIVVGSGQGGQSYLYWKNDGLFQLPVSYFGPADSWSGSPGYNDFAINFKRTVTARCMECHSTFAGALFPENIASNRFKKSAIIYGVSCESCHGPAAKHASFHETHPEEKNARFVLGPGTLNRQLQLDLCGLCHSGLQEALKPAFSFSPGDSLSLYYKINNDTSNPDNVDVHGNKFALFQSSKCFRMSPSMTCSTCHNTHENERAKQEIFVTKCMSCHTGDHASIPRVQNTTSNNLKPGEKHNPGSEQEQGPEMTQAEIKQNCVSCHMPARSSNSLTMRLENEQAPRAAVLRTHHISIYPEETEKLYQYIDSTKGRVRKN
ncbi:multiheme c-type cytochrome [Flavitalea sp.]|nr:multiheme c-type cytochrome [Flavitalea sp.]